MNKIIYRRANKEEYAKIMRSFYNEHWFTITNVHFLLTNSPKNRTAMRRKLSVFVRVT